MKKLFILASLAVVSSLASCSEEIVAPDENGSKITINVSQEQGTRVTLGEETQVEGHTVGHLLWQEGDAIGIWYRNNVEVSYYRNDTYFKATLTGGAQTQFGTFACILPLRPDNTRKYYAFYPYLDEFEAIDFSTYLMYGNSEQSAIKWQPMMISEAGQISPDGDLNLNLTTYSPSFELILDNSDHIAFDRIGLGMYYINGTDTLEWNSYNLKNFVAFTESNGELHADDHVQKTINLKDCDKVTDGRYLFTMPMYAIDGNSSKRQFNVSGFVLNYYKGSEKVVPTDTVKLDAPLRVNVGQLYRVSRSIALPEIK